MEETLMLILRTYLQRISARLSAAEFVDLVKAAIALLTPRPDQTSLDERHQLFCKALQTFDGQFSQPIPTFGHRTSAAVDQWVNRLARYQQLIATDGLQAALSTLTDSPPGPHDIRTALEACNVAIAPQLDTPESFQDLAQILQFEREFSLSSPAPDFTDQVQQAIAKFKANYRPAVDVTQPQWDGELSVKSAFFRSS